MNDRNQQDVNAGDPGSRLPAVSVIIPARNAETTLPATLDSVLSQDYAGQVEVIVADGSDTPAMAAMLQRMYPQVRVVRNPDQITSTGLNSAFQQATAPIIVRCDAHATLPPGYLRRVIETLARTGAANVGGRQMPVGSSLFERAVAMAMTMPLGAGGARYRLGGPEGPTDTVYMGAFRREALEAIGGFDPTLIRNQDDELNWRLRQSGETVWFDPKLVALYQPRGNLPALARQYFEYGRWKSVVLMQHPYSLRARQLAAPLLVLALAASVVLTLAGAPQMALTPLAYLLILIAVSVTSGLRRREPASVLLPLVLVTIHMSWGIGFFIPARRKNMSEDSC